VTLTTQVRPLVSLVSHEVLGGFDRVALPGVRVDRALAGTEVELDSIGVELAPRDWSFHVVAPTAGTSVSRSR